MLRRISLILLLCLLASNSEACPKTDCVRVGAWNIEWLGSDDRHQPMDRKTVSAIASLIADELSIDIISLEEINTTMDGNIHGEQYSLAPWQQLQEALARKGYQVAAGETGYAQHIVLAWRAPVTVLEKPGDLPVPDSYEVNRYCHSSRLRRPLAGRFRAGAFDFWLVGVHLKADVGQAACSADIRKEQVKALAVATRALQNRDRDILLVGDFNASSRNQTLSPLQDAGFEVLDDKPRRSKASFGYTHLNGSSHKRRISGSVIDHIITTPEATGAWHENSTAFYKPADPVLFLHTFSDHVPVWADFSTRGSTGAR